MHNTIEFILKLFSTDEQLMTSSGNLLHSSLILVENKKPSYRWGTARRGRASWNLV